MAIPNAFARSYATTVVVSVADVNQILAAIRTILTATLAVGDRWVETATDVYLSPADPITGNAMKITFTRFAAGEIDMTVVNQNGVGGVTHGINGFVAGQNCKIFAGPTHFMMFRTGVAQDLDFQAYLVDPSPEAMNATSPQLFCRSQRAAAGAGANNISLESFRAIPSDGTGASYNARMTIPAFSASPGQVNGSMLTAGGSECVFPVFFVMYPAGTLANPRGVGQVAQAVWIDQSHTEGQQISFPIDTGVLGTFEVTNMLCESFGAVGNARLALRVG